MTTVRYRFDLARAPSTIRAMCSYLTLPRPGKVAALAFMAKALKRQGGPETITTDGLQPPFAAMSEPGNADKQKNGRWANNSHRPF